jgi:hypothetical protein
MGHSLAHGHGAAAFHFAREFTLEAADDMAFFWVASSPARLKDETVKAVVKFLKIHLIYGRPAAAARENAIPVERTGWNRRKHLSG